MMISKRILKQFAILTVFFFMYSMLVGDMAFQEDKDILFKARMLIREGDLENAIKELNDVIKKLETILTQSKNVAEAHYLLARIYKVVQMDKEYTDHLKSAFKIYPSLSIEEPDPEIRVMAERVKAELEQEKEKIITKEEPIKKKRRKFPVLMTLAGAAAITTAVLLLAKKKQPESETHYDTDVLGIQWIDIPAGSFPMGDNFNEGWTDEQPVHSVNLTAYKISRYEVTYKQYDIFCEETGRNKPDDYGWGRESRPVIGISWEDAGAFCGWLSRKAGKNIHLPSESQWEKAARGTTQGKYPWGNTIPTCDMTNYDNCIGRTMPVGSYPADVSPYGVYDLGGNVSEWCGDWYDPSYYSVTPGNNPGGPGSGSQRVHRGGSWHSDAYHIRSCDRESSGPSTANSRLGFRICCEFSH